MGRVHGRRQEREVDARAAGPHRGPPPEPHLLGAEPELGGHRRPARVRLGDLGRGEVRAAGARAVAAGRQVRRARPRRPARRRRQHDRHLLLAGERDRGHTDPVGHPHGASDAHPDPDPDAVRVGLPRPDRHPHRPADRGAHPDDPADAGRAP